MCFEECNDGVIFLMIAIAFVLVAFLSVVATLSAPPTVRRMANVVIYGSCVAALVSKCGGLVRLLAAGIELHGDREQPFARYIFT